MLENQEAHSFPRSCGGGGWGAGQDRAEGGSHPVSPRGDSAGGDDFTEEEMGPKSLRL